MNLTFSKNDTPLVGSFRTGPFTCTIKQASQYLSGSSKAEAIRFVIERPDFPDARLLLVTLWLTTREGSQNKIGMHQLAGLASVLGIQKMEERKQKVYSLQKGAQPEDGVRYPVFEGKTFGAVLQVVEDFNDCWEGEDGTLRPNRYLDLVESYDLQTMKTGAEINHGMEATRVAKLLKNLKPSRIVGDASNPRRYGVPAAATSPQQDAIDTLEEDLPF